MFVGTALLYLTGLNNRKLVLGGRGGSMAWGHSNLLYPLSSACDVFFANYISQRCTYAWLLRTVWFLYAHVACKVPARTQAHHNITLRCELY
jgi:hypothetical protein